MKNIFVLGLCLVIMAGSSVLAGLTKGEELQKRIAELTVKQSEVAIRLNDVTSEYTVSNKKIQSLRKDIRKGKVINNNYDKTGVDEETAGLIDRYRAAEKKYAELKKELDEHLAKSDAGVARAKTYEENLNSLKTQKKSFHEIIQQRAKILQEQKKITEELVAAEAALLAQEAEDGGRKSED